MIKLFALVFCFSLSAVGQLLPLDITNIRTYSFPLVKGKPVQTYSLIESNNFLVVNTYSTFDNGTDSPVNPEKAFVLEKNEIETLHKLLQQLITSNRFDMLSLQGLDKDGKVIEERVFNWTFIVSFKSSPIITYLGHTYSPAAKQVLELIINAANDQKHKTLKDTLKK